MEVLRAYVLIWSWLVGQGLLVWEPFCVLVCIPHLTVLGFNLFLPHPALVFPDGDGALSPDQASVKLCSGGSAVLLPPQHLLQLLILWSSLTWASTMGPTLLTPCWPHQTERSQFSTTFYIPANMDNVLQFLNAPKEEGIWRWGSGRGWLRHSLFEALYYHLYLLRQPTHRYGAWEVSLPEFQIASETPAPPPFRNFSHLGVSVSCSRLSLQGDKSKTLLPHNIMR